MQTSENNLRAIRRRARLPLLGLSVKAAVSTATLSQIERWGLLPSEPVRERIACALNVPQATIWPSLDQEDGQPDKGS